jgi:hypothetical protein
MQAVVLHANLNGPKIAFVSDKFFHSSAPLSFYIATEIQLQEPGQIKQKELRLIRTSSLLRLCGPRVPRRTVMVSPSETLTTLPVQAREESGARKRRTVVRVVRRGRFKAVPFGAGESTWKF